MLARDQQHLGLLGIKSRKRQMIGMNLATQNAAHYEHWTRSRARISTALA